MEATPPPPLPEKPKEKTAIIWPLVLNLGVLLVVAAVGGSGMLPGAVGVLGLVNGVAGVINLLAGNRLHYALAFFLSGLVLLLIGLGVCGLLLQGLKGGGH